MIVMRGIEGTGNIESTRNTAAILNLEWSSRSIRISGNPMEAGASSLPHPQALLAEAGGVGSLTAIRVIEGVPHLHPECRAAVTRVESDDLARFEGEGGLEGPEPGGP